MKKNILMYDSSHGYLAFMKKQFKTEYEIFNYEKLEVSEIDLDSYNAVIFIINNEIELIDLMYIYTKVEYLFIFTNFKKINKRMEEFNNITILNLHKSKKQIAEQIRFWLDVFEANKQEKCLNANIEYA